MSSYLARELCKQVWGEVFCAREATWLCLWRPGFVKAIARALDSFLYPSTSPGTLQLPPAPLFRTRTTPPGSSPGLRMKSIRAWVILSGPEGAPSFCKGGNSFLEQFKDLSATTQLGRGSVRVAFQACPVSIFPTCRQHSIEMIEEIDNPLVYVMKAGHQKVEKFAHGHKESDPKST